MKSFITPGSISFPDLCRLSCFNLGIRHLDNITRGVFDIYGEDQMYYRTICRLVA